MSSSRAQRLRSGRRAMPATVIVAISLAIAAPAGAGDGFETRLQALDCDRLSATDVREVLASAPAPRIIVISGSFDLITMDSFSRFLAAMGFPAERIRNPADGAWSYASATPGARLAGMLAWHYEHDGMTPMLIGYSGGGMVALRALHELAGAFGDRIAVVDPHTGEALPRDTITDPFDGRQRPVVGLRVPYATAIATGKWPRLVLGQWTMLDKIRSVPDTVGEFTGFTLEWDGIAGTFPGSEPYRATGSADVRNVTLPSGYHHLDLPQTEALAADAATRAWIDAYAPGVPLPPDGGAVTTTNLLHAADVWHSVKRHWCLEARHVAGARSAR